MKINCMQNDAFTHSKPAQYLMKEWNGTSLSFSDPLRSSNSTKHMQPSKSAFASLNNSQAAAIVPGFERHAVYKLTILTIERGDWESGLFW